MEQSSDANMQIFKSIGDVLADSDFTIANDDFYQKYSKNFDDDDENKHEYKQIYEEYLSITEKVIEARIREQYGFDEEAFATFLESLAEKKGEYEAENADTVNILFSMIEFDQFKKKMLEAKKGLVDSESTAEDEDALQEYHKLQVEDEWANF